FRGRQASQQQHPGHHHAGTEEDRKAHAVASMVAAQWPPQTIAVAPTEPQPLVRYTVWPLSALLVCPPQIRGRYQPWTCSISFAGRRAASSAPSADRALRIASSRWWDSRRTSHSSRSPAPIATTSA